MKKVKFFKKIQEVYVRDIDGKEFSWNPGGDAKLKEGTGISFEVEGTFIDWGLDTDERMGSWTVAIVQLNDGSIDYIHPVTSKMKFITYSCGVEIKHDKEQDELNISNQPHEIQTAAVTKNVSSLSIHIAKHIVGRNREKVYDWIDKMKGKQVQLIIE